MENFTDSDRATWLGFPNVARHFARSVSFDYDTGSGVVLEIKVPTDQLECMVAPKYSRQREEGTRYNNVHISNLQEMKQEFNEEDFKTPLQAFRHYCEISAQTDLSNYDKEIQDAEIVHFAVQHEIKLENVLGVWDPFYSDTPVFEELGSFVKRLRKRPALGERKQKIKREVEDELRELSYLEDKIEYVVHKLRRLEDKMSNGENFDSNIEYYNNSLRILDEKLEKHFDVNLETKKTKINREKVHELKRNYESIENEIKKIMRKEKRRALKEDWSKEDIKEELNYEKKINKRVIQEISENFVFLSPQSKVH